MPRHKRRRTKKSDSKNLLSTSKHSPIELIEALANGQDLTQTSYLLEYIEKEELCAEDLPSPEQWAHIYNIIISYYRYAAVKTSERLNAAKSLAEYRHSKRKATEESDDASNSVQLPPLSDDEIDKFWESFSKQGLG